MLHATLIRKLPSPCGLQGTVEPTSPERDLGDVPAEFAEIAAVSQFVDWHGNGVAANAGAIVTGFGIMRFLSDMHIARLSWKRLQRDRQMINRQKIFAMHNWKSPA